MPCATRRSIKGRPKPTSFPPPLVTPAGLPLLITTPEGAALWEDIAPAAPSPSPAAEAGDGDDGDADGDGAVGSGLVDEEVLGSPPLTPPFYTPSAVPARSLDARSPGMCAHARSFARLCP